MSETPRNPMQPLVLDKNGAVRFKANAIVDRLVDFARSHGYSLNNIAIDPTYTQDDYEQLMQLIGYSLKGFHELSSVSDETALAAAKTANEQFGEEKSRQGCRSDGCGWHIGVQRTELMCEARQIDHQEDDDAT